MNSSTKIVPCKKNFFIIYKEVFIQTSGVKEKSLISKTIFHTYRFLTATKKYIFKLVAPQERYVYSWPVS